VRPLPDGRHLIALIAETSVSCIQHRKAKRLSLRLPAFDPSASSQTSPPPPAMPKEDAIHVPAQVLSPLGVAAYRMRLSNGYELVAHVTRKLQPIIGAIQPGDTVELELSPFDLSRGRIIGRCSTP